MRENFQKEIGKLKSDLIKMASLVDDQVNSAFNALATGDIEICRGSKSKDIEIDTLDNLIQAHCETILALYQPVAADLRFVISAIMINNQLERCGDIAVNICQRVRKTGAHHALIEEAGLLEMGRQAKEMIQNANDSFINNNTELAKQVLTDDDKVDDLNKQIFNFLISKMQIDSSLVEPCSHLIVLTRNIERLADHATNIAEDVLFFVEAILISHKKKLQRYYKSSDGNGEIF